MHKHTLAHFHICTHSSAAHTHPITHHSLTIRVYSHFPFRFRWEGELLRHAHVRSHTHALAHLHMHALIRPHACVQSQTHITLINAFIHILPFVLGGKESCAAQSVSSLRITSKWFCWIPHHESHKHQVRAILNI